LELEDSQSQMRTIEQLLLPVGCWRAGRRVDGVTSALLRRLDGADRRKVRKRMRGEA
jgi:hypothetical protein